MRSILLGLGLTALTITASTMTVRETTLMASSTTALIAAAVLTTTASRIAAPHIVRPMSVVRPNSVLQPRSMHACVPAPARSKRGIFDLARQ